MTRMAKAVEGGVRLGADIKREAQREAVFAVGIHS